MTAGAQGEDVVGLAIAWPQGALLGPIATSVAVIAVAATGLLLLSGRIDLRRGGRVVFGCFILFGASTIARGILDVITSGNSVILMQSPQPVALDESSIPFENPSGEPAHYDPYAGASVPPRP